MLPQPCLLVTMSVATDMIPPFKGDVAAWLKKVELVAKLPHFIWKEKHFCTSFFLIFSITNKGFKYFNERSHRCISLFSLLMS